MANATEGVSVGGISFRAVLPCTVGVLLAACGSANTTPEAVTDSGIGLADRRLDPGAAPCDNFDLRHWKLTLPSGAEVSAAELNAGFQMADSFYTDPVGGGLVFRSPNIAGHTEDSLYSRSELCEMRAPDGPASAAENNWTTALGGVLKARLRVDAVSTTGDPRKLGRVVIGQIHGPHTEVVRLYFDKKPEAHKARLYIASEDVQSGNSVFSTDIVPDTDDEGIALGEIFEYRIELAQRTLHVTIARQGRMPVTHTQDIDPRYDGLSLYFKAGVYNQNDTGDPADFAQATFMALEASHP